MALSKSKVSLVVLQNIRWDLYLSDANSAVPNVLHLVISLYDTNGNLVDSYDDQLSNYPGGGSAAVSNFLNNAVVFAGSQKGYTGTP